MAEPDAFYDLEYLGLPGLGETDASAIPGDTSAALPPTQSPPPPQQALPVVPFPGADPPSAIAPGQAMLGLPPAPAGPRRRAGAAVLLCGVGVGTGALVGGPWGAGAGLLFAGATMNAYRAQQLYATGSPVDRGEAIKSTVMAVIGLGLGSYLGYRAHGAASGRDDDDED